MTYTPKPGDRVLIPAVYLTQDTHGDQHAVDVGALTYTVFLNADAEILPDTRPIDPPLPPEPPVGSVVRANGRLWWRDKDFDWTDGEDMQTDWSDLATADDLSPVVAVDDVLAWARNVQGWRLAADEIEDEFGGWTAQKMLDAVRGAGAGGSNDDGLHHHPCCGCGKCGGGFGGKGYNHE